MEKYLLQRTINGDKDAAIEFLKLYRPSVRRWIRKYHFLERTGVITLEDLEQVGLASIYLAMFKYDPKRNASIRTYFYTVVRNAVLCEIRKAQRDIGTYSSISLDAIAASNERDEQVAYKDLLADPHSLNAYDEVMYVHDLEEVVFERAANNDQVNRTILELLSKGYRYEEISKMLSMSKKEIYNRVYRMRKKGKVDSNK